MTRIADQHRAAFMIRRALLRRRLRMAGLFVLGVVGVTGIVLMVSR